MSCATIIWPIETITDPDILAALGTNAKQLHFNCAVHDPIDYQQPTKFSTQFRAEIARSREELASDQRFCVPDRFRWTMCGPGVKPTDACTFADCGIVSEYLCDFPMGEGKTCDIGLCRAHRRQQIGGFDVCPQHDLIRVPVGP